MELESRVTRDVITSPDIWGLMQQLDEREKEGWRWVGNIYLVCVQREGGEDDEFYYCQAVEKRN